VTIFNRVWEDDGGQDIVEYALMAGLISIVAYAAIQASGNSIATFWNTVNGDVSSAT
jgi:pilus assembly protein Flp/PilA